MQRALICFWIIAIALTGDHLFAQQPTAGRPAAYANTHKFTDQDGVKGFNYSEFYTGPSGRRYFSPYAAEGTQILGNNWRRVLRRMDSISRGEKTFIELPVTQAGAPVETWVATRKYLFQLKADTLCQTLRVPDFIEKAQPVIYRAAAGFFFIPENLKTSTCYHFSFQTQSFHPLPNWQAIAAARHCKILPDSNGQLYLIVHFQKDIRRYRIDNATQQLAGLDAVPAAAGAVFCILSESSFITSNPSADGKCSRYIYWNRNQPARLISSPTALDHAGSLIVSRLADNTFRVEDLSEIRSGTPAHHYFINRDGLQQISLDPVLGGYYVATPNKPVRVFPWIKQYPFLYGGTNSAATFTLQQDDAGNIWAGSYNGSLSRIVGDQVVPVPYAVYRLLNGGMWYGGRMYLIEEGRSGLAAFTPTSVQKNLSDSVTGYYTYVAPDQYFYYGTYDYQGLRRTPGAALQAGKPQWEVIDSAKGLNLQNILTITADTLGRIWCGHPSSGLAIYDPAKNSAVTWRTDEGKSNVTAMASLTDSMGTVWLGGKGALWYYNEYSLPATPENCRRITHPLLGSNFITALTIWKKDWLIIAAYDRMLLLDLKAFYRDGAVTLRYLNPQEAGFTSFTEQNTMLTSHTDGTVWFSTSDNVYQWDVAKWLALPLFTTEVSVKLNGKGHPEQTLASGTSCRLPPGLRTFDMQVNLTSPDGLPRYLRTALVHQGDSVIWDETGLQSTYSFPNTEPGHYQFLVAVFETDGSTQTLKFDVYLRPHFWQTMWFWALVTALLLGFSFAIFYYHLKARTKKAELEAFRAEQHKKLSDLRLLTTANQFRPHFILNALNTVGSRMQGDPHTEQVLSSLGNSINIIFNNARRQGVLHPLAEEWKLVEEVIQIHRLMYLPELALTLPDPAELQRLSGWLVPLGLLQIPVENALLHGLGNLQQGPYQLNIETDFSAEGLALIITDNGVGLAAARGLSNATSHGTGIKNLDAMLQLLAESGAGEIKIHYTDKSAATNKKNSTFGTRVTILIPKSFSYG